MPLDADQEHEIFPNGRPSHPEAGMTDAEFRRARRLAAQERQEKNADGRAAQVAERIQLEKDTGTPYRPEERVFVAIRDSEIIQQDATDSREKALLKESLARIERSAERAEKKNRTEYLATEFDKIVDCVHTAFELERAGHTKEAMARLDEINETHVERVLAREITEVTLDRPDAPEEPAADEA